jgi:hypothetical protein
LHCSFYIDTRGVTNINPNSTLTSSLATPAPSVKGKKNKAKPTEDNSMALAQAYVGDTIRGASPMPHLSISNAQAIGVGFYKMPLEAMSADVLSSRPNASKK